MAEDERLAALREDIARILAAALETEKRHVADMERRDELHLAEAGRRDELHVHELERRDELHAHEMEMIGQALQTRDIIGQAKGVIMASLCCSADEAFKLLKHQSQHENVKLVDVAIEIAKRASSPSAGPYTGPATP
jgi:hypothetical protein